MGLAVFLGDNQGGGVRPGVDQRQAPLHAEQAHGGIQAVGGGGVRPNDGRLNALRQAKARRRVHDVRVADAIDFDELLGVARGGDADVVEQKRFAGPGS